MTSEQVRLLVDDAIAQGAIEPDMRDYWVRAYAIAPEVFVDHFERLPLLHASREVLAAKVGMTPEMLDRHLAADLQLDPGERVI